MRVTKTVSAAVATIAVSAVLCLACSRAPWRLVSMGDEPGALLPAYDRGRVPALKAAVMAGSGDYATVGAAGCDYTGLAEALERAPPGVLVFYLMDPVYETTSLTIARDASLIGFGARDTVLQGAKTPEEASGGVLRVEAGVRAYVRGVTIRAGRVVDVPRRGGGVSNSGSLVMEDCAIVDNLATYGVGVWTEGRLELRRCVVAGNRGLKRPMADEYSGVDCGGHGAGLRVEKGGFALVEDSVIALNRSVAGGGGLHVSCEAGARLVGSVLYGNQAVKRGGAVDSAGGDIEMLRCTVAGNTSGEKGSAIFHRGKLSLAGCLFSGNGPGAPYYLATDKGGEYGRGVFALNEGNFDDSGTVPLAATGDARYVRSRTAELLRSYGAGSGASGGYPTSRRPGSRP